MKLNWEQGLVRILIIVSIVGGVIGACTTTANATAPITTFIASILLMPLGIFIVTYGVAKFLIHVTQWIVRGFKYTK